MQRPPATMAPRGFFGRPSAITIWVPPAAAILPASILVRMPPRESSEPAPPAIASIAGVICSTSGMCRAADRGRGGGVEPVDVGEQHQQIGADHGGDAGGEAVVVAIADLAGRDRVVLVDDGHGAQVEQPAWWRGR